MQQELLKKALKIVRAGSEIVYSTCSILKKENEDNLQKLINDKKNRNYSYKSGYIR